MLPIALLFLLLQNHAPAVPAIVSDPDFPLRVQLAQTGSSAGSFQHLSVWGHGNILGPPLQGFDYTAECNQQFAPRPEGDQYFRARWKKPGQKLEILIQQLGTGRVTACELKVGMQDQAYELNPTGPKKPTMMMMPLARPAVPVLEPDPNFPLRVQIWVRNSGTSSMSGSHTEGYGNIQGETLTGFDFGNTCPIQMSMGMGRGGDIYQARWLEQGFRMEILVQEVGTRQQNVCQMDVGLKSTPYSAPVPGQRPVAPPRTPSPQAPKSNSDIPPPGR
jgi:hypothetical protein